MRLFIAVILTRRLESDGNSKGTTTLHTQRKTVTVQVIAGYIRIFVHLYATKPDFQLGCSDCHMTKRTQFSTAYFEWYCMLL